MTHASSSHLRVIDLGTMAYDLAWEQQQQVHEQMVNDASLPPAVLLVEHEPVITVSQRKASPSHLLASKEQLEKLGIAIHETNRGGDITYHGPGQLVAYPILRLADYRMNVGRYMRLLEEVVIRTLAQFAITSQRDESGTGVWVKQGSDQTSQAKICAMGVRVKRNITLHGLALNVTTNLSHFETIVPCGLADRSVTSMKQELETRQQPVPEMQQVKAALVEALSEQLASQVT